MSAKGGVFAQGQWRFIGEQGPEAVIPLDRLHEFTGGRRGQGGGGGGMAVNLNLGSVSEGFLDLPAGAQWELLQPLLAEGVVRNGGFRRHMAHHLGTTLR